MSETEESLSIPEDENNLGMNGHSIDESSSEMEQVKKSNEKIIDSDVTSQKSKLLRKMSNGEAVNNEDKTNSASEDDEQSDKCDNSITDVSDNVKDKSDNSIMDASDDVKDKSDNSVIDVSDDLKNENNQGVSDLITKLKDKSDDVVAEISINSDLNNSKDVVEIDGDEKSVNKQNGEVSSDSEETKTADKTESSSSKDDCEMETINDDESDIEMIEESDPLAISDVDVKLAREQKMKKEKENLIIMNNNKILKSSPSLTVTGVKNATRSATKAARAPPTPPVVGISPANSNVSASIQSALQAIAASGPGIQGLQTAYATAIQQALLTQANTISSPQYVNQLQQCYSSLGEMQDEAYVIEAPSFIVPYVMEGKPKEAIKDFLQKIKDGEKEKIGEESKDQKEKENIEQEENSTEEKNKSTNVEKSKDDKEEENIDKCEEEKPKQQSDLEEKDNNVCDSKENNKELVEDEKENQDHGKDTDTKKTDDDEDYKPESQAESDLSETEENPRKDEKIKDDSDKENSKSDDTDDVIALDKGMKSKVEDLSHLGRWEPFYKSSLGKFFLDLGLNQVEEYIQSDIVRMTRRKLEKMKTNPSKQDVSTFKNLEYQLKRTREKNSHFNLDLKTCRHCTFKTESELVMAKHLEAPHMINYTYRCNFCEFETRGPQSILFHMEALHNVKGRLERAPAFFQCPLCPFEENTKSKMTRHAFSCIKRYKPEKNLDLIDWEPPAKIPKLQRGGRGNINRMQDNARMPGLFAKAFAGMNVNPNMLLAGGPSMNVNSRGRGRPVGSYKNLLPAMGKNTNQLGAARFLNSLGGASTVQQLSIANQVLQSVSQGSAARLSRVIPSSTSAIPNFGSSSSITIQSVNNKANSTKLPQQPSISITPLVRGNVNKNGTTSKDGGKPTYVICEICDGYIKDLEQLRNHMNLIHKVKIHPKMIYNRPPLNCQKCQQRFFTDQGLERHLLGTHGLVTSSMQEAANKGKDSGRCPICGKVFQWKLLNHVSRDHKLTLKPAHLSYKCTVCTATFNMYRLFENHVYSAHSVINKNKGGDSTSTSSKKSVEGPLKINDEITIIPQPSSKSKPADTSKPSKSNDTPMVSKEITITKVGGTGPRPASKKRGVEIISLDDSPAKRLLDDPKKKSAVKKVKVSL